MLTAWKTRLSRELAAVVSDLWGVEHEVAAEVAPRRELGDLAFPLALELARVVKRRPRDIAEAIVERWQPPAEVARVEIAGPGFLNVFLDRPRLLAEIAGSDPLAAAREEAAPPTGKVIVEHTNINPNKAAHIGHLRNAVLGDVLARVLGSLGHAVEVQNYIDDTGVQLADVVVGFVDVEGKSVAEVEAAPEPFDYLCWDLYSRVGRWYEEDPERKGLRRETLHALERGDPGERGEMGRLVARRIVGRHLATMARLGVGYDLVTRESDILGLDFFEVAFEKLKASGAVRLEAEGKNEGCWVMPLSESEEFAGLEDPDKVIVRSDGTVTYVGKDIAYQLWKFGLLGRDFEYVFWDEEEVWRTTSAPGGDDGWGGGGPAEATGARERPAFGGGDRVVNVIDARQSYLQRIVRAGLEALGYVEEAKRSIHFAYEMVALTPTTARQLGQGDGDRGEGADGTGAGKAVEMSGRKGIGVKADDLIDQLHERARGEIAERSRDLSEDEMAELAGEIATAALRFFMVKATTTRVIAFDFDEALAFEGETGPYLQYSWVRSANILRRLAEEGLATEVTPEAMRGLPAGALPDDLWDLALEVARIGETVERAAESLEISLVARQALELAQKFNAVYHRHPILQETDEAKRSARLAATLVFRRGLAALAELLGVPLPERM